MHFFDKDSNYEKGIEYYLIPHTTTRWRRCVSPTPHEWLPTLSVWVSWTSHRSMLAKVSLSAGQCQLPLWGEGGGGLCKTDQRFPDFYNALKPPIISFLHRFFHENTLISRFFINCILNPWYLYMYQCVHFTTEFLERDHFVSSWAAGYFFRDEWDVVLHHFLDTPCHSAGPV